METKLKSGVAAENHPQHMSRGLTCQAQCFLNTLVLKVAGNIILELILVAFDDIKVYFGANTV